MSERVYQKLVRDRIPDIIRQQGETPVTRTLSETEYLTCLHDKLREELAEYLQAPSKEEALMEFCDLCEVLAAVAEARHFSKAEVTRGRAEKCRKNGGFQQKIWLEKVLEGESAHDSE